MLTPPPTTSPSSRAPRPRRLRAVALALTLLAAPASLSRAQSPETWSTESSAGAPGAASPAGSRDAELPPAMRPAEDERSVADPVLLAARERRLRATRRAGVLALAGGALMGLVASALPNPFALGMTSVGLIGAGLFVVPIAGSLSRSVQVEQGALDPTRWAAMRRGRRSAGLALVSFGMSALSATAMTLYPTIVLVIGVPLGASFVLMGSALLLSSMDAIRSAPRVRPTFGAITGRAGRGARVGLCVSF